MYSSLNSFFRRRSMLGTAFPLVAPEEDIFVVDIPVTGFQLLNKPTFGDFFHSLPDGNTSHYMKGLRLIVWLPDTSANVDL